MGIISKLADQARKPTGLLGRFTLWTFNLQHSRLTDWGLKHVSIQKNATILDVGCGGGLTVHKLAAIATEGKVYGVDFSEASVAASRRKNQQWIQMGRVEIQLASVSHLPFPDNMFDLVTAVETHYFWPDLLADMREVMRLLKPGGKFIIMGEAYKGGKTENLYQKLAGYVNMNELLSIHGHGELLSKAGYADLEMFEEASKGWICGIGKKPSSFSGG